MNEAPCFHVVLKRQNVGDQHWYRCETCGAKLLAGLWDGKVKLRKVQDNPHACNVCGADLRIIGETEAPRQPSRESRNECAEKCLLLRELSEKFFKPANELINDGWQLAHDPRICGHPRACWLDRNYPESERNYNAETHSGEPPIDYRCIMCEAEQEIADLKGIIVGLKDMAEGATQPISEIRAELSGSPGQECPNCGVAHSDGRMYRDSEAPREPSRLELAHKEMHRYQEEIGDSVCEMCEALERVGEVQHPEPAE